MISKLISVQLMQLQAIFWQREQYWYQIPFTWKDIIHVINTARVSLQQIIKVLFKNYLSLFFVLLEIKDCSPLLPKANTNLQNVYALNGWERG